MNPRPPPAESYVADLIDSKAFDLVQALLTDFPFLIGRLKALGNRHVRILIADYEAALVHLGSDNGVVPWAAFFRDHAHILERGSPAWPAYKILLQLAVEYRDGSPISNAAEAWLREGHCDWMWLRNPRWMPVDPTPHHAADKEAAWRSPLSTMALEDRIVSWGTTWDHDIHLTLWKLDGAPQVLLGGHTGRIKGAAPLPDGRFLTWGDDKILRVWSRDGDSISTVAAHRAYIAGAAYLPNDRILSWSGDHTLRIWTLDGTLLSVLEGHSGEISGARVGPNGQILSWSNKDLLLWNSDGVLAARLKGHTGSVGAARTEPDGRIFSWSGSREDYSTGLFSRLPSHDRTVRVWDSTGHALAVMDGHTGFLRGAASLALGRVITWSSSKIIWLWSDASELLGTFSGELPVPLPDDTVAYRKGHLWEHFSIGGESLGTFQPATKSPEVQNAWRDAYLKRARNDAEDFSPRNRIEKRSISIDGVEWHGNYVLYASHLLADGTIVLNDHNKVLCLQLLMGAERRLLPDLLTEVATPTSSHP